MENKVGKTEKGSYLWVVKNYSLLRKKTGVGKSIESEEFTAGGHQWAIAFYPNGKDIDAYNDGYISLYIVLKSESSVPISFLHEIFVLGHSDNGHGRQCGLSLFKLDEGIPCLFPGEFCGVCRFMKREVLESPGTGYLRDDCLKIRCTVGVLTCHHHNQPLLMANGVSTSKIENQPPLKVPAIGVLTSKIEKQPHGDETDFCNLLESKKGADVFFRVEKERLCAHKWILADRSPVFRSLLSGCNKPQEFIITNMESRIFKAMLWFIYKGNLLEEDEQAFDAHGPCVFESFWGKMLAATTQFGLKSLRRVCESRILESTTLETVAYTLHLADLYGATQLKSACLKFAVKNQAGMYDSYIFDLVSYLLRLATIIKSIDFDRSDALGWLQLPQHKFSIIVVRIA
ncbi:hypothetical protein DH2020_019459 [Rehmannia glutinosa]|uniref:BTB/POZ and MATH domain-containing protein n=1 Tax=Rehmannia glutinosa TaxID=99300 RepID=A0ABR0WLY1_REHGL